jgi:hypothetical protein
LNRAALGVRMHSGWGILVTIAGVPETLEVIDRRRIVITDPKIPMANQPYHFAADLEFSQAEKHIANCAVTSERLALSAVEGLLQELKERHFRIIGTSILMGSGRTLPELEKILSAHPLIHTAEGEFFRNAVRKSCEELRIPVTAIIERELDEQAKSTFGNGAAHIKKRVETMGASIGPPWTKDHKSAALAAAMMLT